MRFSTSLLVALSAFLSSCTEDFSTNVYRLPDSVERLGCASELCAHVNADWPMPHPPSSGLPNPASYSLSGGVVTDDITHLAWEARPWQKEMTWPEAARYCESLELGGATNWRLPSVVELMSLIDFTQSPMIDNRVFSATWSAYWTFQRGDDQGTTYWTVSFQNGTTNDYAEHYGSEATTLPVRCVR
ncbi:MAG TPA: DUF1566 domain-containing protein [Polyangiaceae bacterium]|nr:DUF1566 domain-containing protein [Polyangiaceae bacterium]